MGLEITNLQVDLQKQEILHGISLSIQNGEFISLLGPSGCGKTTLLKTIAGLLDARCGEICWNGSSLMKLPPEKRGTVIVFQDLRLFPHMTVEKNLAFPMELQRVPKEEQQSRIKRLLAAVQLSGFEKRSIREMSGGQMQRIALARALAAAPKVLLLDEPFSGLDEQLRLEMGALVKQLHEEWKITTILVTHDKREALQMSDRIALMQEGRIVQYDTPQNSFSHPVSRAAADYFGKANYLAGQVSGGSFHCSLGNFPADVPDGSYLGMLRPFALKPQKALEGGLIEEIIYMGETAELKIRCGSQTLLSQISGSELKEKELASGDRVCLTVNTCDLVYFPDKTSDKGEKNEDEKDSI